MKRALLLAAPAVLALGLVACGDDDDDAPDSTDATEETATEETATDDTSTEDTSGGDITVPDISIPDISIPDITLPGGTLPTSISLPEEASEIFEQVLTDTFPNLDAEQVSCLAEAFQGEIDLSQIQSVAEDCGIDPADLQPGG